VLVSGEPGIGKSRLAASLRDWLKGEDYTRLRYFSSPHHQDSALYPFIAQLERAALFEREDSDQKRLDKLEALLAPASPSEEDVALLAELLSLPATSRYPLPPSTSQRKKEKTFAALLRQLEALARQNPVLMIFEDLHWIDPSSRELLDRTIERIASLPVLLFATFRPEFAPPWSGLPQVTALTLARLDRRTGTAMVESIAGNAALSGEAAAEIVERADGVPLFVEELTKAVLEAGGRGEGIEKTLARAVAPSAAVPAALHASLMARLDRLGRAPKEIAQIAAAIGREFSYGLLAPVAERGEGELQDALSHLADAGLIFRRGDPPYATYLFKHALVRDAAYASLLRAKRQELHARVAAALEQDFADIVERQPELIAQHLSAAGAAARAIEYWFKAGERAKAHSANREAVAQLRAALQLAEQLPDPTERAAWELRISIALGPALMVTTSSGAPEVIGVYARARRLAQEAGRSLELFQALWGSWLASFSGGDSRSAAALADQLFALARQQTSEELMLQSHHAAWTTALYLQGDLRAVQRSVESGIQLYRREAYQHHALVYGGHDPAVCGHGIGGLVSALLGHLERALFEANEALALGHNVSHHGSLAHAYWLASEVHYLRRDAAAASEIASEMLPFVAVHGSAVALANAMLFQGWGLVASGRIDEGLAQLRDGLSRWRRTGSKINGPFRLLRAADGLLLADETDEALALLAEAAALAEETGEHWSDAEVDRLSGIAKLRRSVGASDLAQAEQHLRRAVAVAERQSAKLLQLRSATSLARLWRDQGKPAEARDLLAPICGWFTEGFDTLDLKEAKALLDELA
jgi:predicted ATPase